MNGEAKSWQLSVCVIRLFEAWNASGVQSPTRHPQQVERWRDMGEDRKCTRSCSNKNRWSVHPSLQGLKKENKTLHKLGAGVEERRRRRSKTMFCFFLRRRIPNLEPNLPPITSSTICKPLFLWFVACMCSHEFECVVLCTQKSLIDTYSKVEHGIHWKRGMSWEEGFPMERKIILSQFLF